MKDFIIWMVTKDNKLFKKIAEITGFISDIKENHILIHSNNKQYMDAKLGYWRMQPFLERIESFLNSTSET